VYHGFYFFKLNIKVMKSSFNGVVVVYLLIKEKRKNNFKFGNERDTCHGSFYDP